MSAGLTTAQSVPEDIKLLQDSVADIKRALGLHSVERLHYFKDIRLLPRNPGTGGAVPGRFPPQKLFKNSLVLSVSFGLFHFVPIFLSARCLSFHLSSLWLSVCPLFLPLSCFSCWAARSSRPLSLSRLVASRASLKGLLKAGCEQYDECVACRRCHCH